MIYAIKARALPRFKPGVLNLFHLTEHFGLKKIPTEQDLKKKTFRGSVILFKKIRLELVCFDSKNRKRGKNTNYRFLSPRFKVLVLQLKFLMQ